MKIKEDFVKTELGDDTILVAIGEKAEHFHGIVRLNETAAFIVDQLARDTTEEEILTAILKEYDVERSVAQAHVSSVLESLRKINALAE